MKRQFISLVMMGILASGMSIGAYADVVAPTTPVVTETPVVVPVVTPVVTPVVVPEPVKAIPEQSKDLNNYKALQNKLEALKKQKEGAEDRIKKANEKDKKSLQNSTAAFEKQMQMIQEQIKRLMEAQKNDDQYSDKQEKYIKSIESIVKKNQPELRLITADQIVTDNPLFKSDLPLAVKEGVVYMSQSTLEKSFGIKFKYVQEQKKFVTKIDGTLVEIFLLGNYVEIDGMPVKAAAKPIAIKENIYFPIKGLAKLLNIDVKWDFDNKLLIIDDLDIANPVIVPAPVVVPITPVAPTTPVVPTTPGN